MLFRSDLVNNADVSSNIAANASGLVPPAKNPIPPAKVTFAANLGVAAPSIGADTRKGNFVHGYIDLSVAMSSGVPIYEPDPANLVLEVPKVLTRSLMLLSQAVCYDGSDRMKNER